MMAKPMVELRLPYPPSVNHYWRHVGSRVLVSAEGRAYRQAVALIVRMAKYITLTQRLSVEILLHPPDARRRDIDNTAKAVLDALRDARLYEDDSQVDELVIRRREKRDGGSCTVRIDLMEEGD